MTESANASAKTNGSATSRATLTQMMAKANMRTKEMTKLKSKMDMYPKLLVAVTFFVSLKPTNKGAKPTTPESSPKMIASAISPFLNRSDNVTDAQQCEPPV